MKSILFPQFKTNPLTDWQIQLPKLGKMQINLHRPIPFGFVVKQVRESQEFAYVLEVWTD